MTAIAWPEALVPQTAQLLLRKSGAQFASPFNGTVQSLEFIAERWVASVSLAQMAARNPRGVHAFCNRLAGGVQRVQVWAFHTRGVPRGTMRGSPVLASDAARGDTSLAISGATAASGSGPITLLADDFIGVGGQLFQVVADTTLSGGAGSVPVIGRVRSALLATAPVVWLRPTCEMVLPARQAGPLDRPGAIDSAALDLEEVF